MIFLHQKKKKIHFIGFIVSLILTVIPFFVLKNEININIKKYAILICLILQISTQIICFLSAHLFNKDKWNLLSFLFSILIIIILVSFSLWIMYNLNKNMV